jgi:amino acid transporter
MIPLVSLRETIFWSTIAFAFAGVESASTMAEEIRDARRTLPRAVMSAAVLITLLYVAGTAAILVAVPRDQVSGLQGIMQAVVVLTSRVGASWLAPLIALLVVVAAAGGVFGWFAAVARLPLVAGLDRFLPPAFGRVDSGTGTPRAALLTQAVISAVFVVLGQAGTSVRGAYEILVSLSIITNFIPFLFIFAALVRCQHAPLPDGVVRVPAGPVAARVAGTVGFATTSLAIVLACVPGPGEPNAVLAVAKVVGASAAIAGIGVVVYARGRRRHRTGRAALVR